MAHDREKDTHDLALALDAIREAHPDATRVLFETSDQNMGYGYWLHTVRRADGTDLEVTTQLHSEVQDLVGDIDWKGPIGEDEHGYGWLDLATAPTLLEGK